MATSTALGKSVMTKRRFVLLIEKGQAWCLASFSLSLAYVSRSLKCFYSVDMGTWQQQKNTLLRGVMVVS